MLATTFLLSCLPFAAPADPPPFPAAATRSFGHRGDHSPSAQPPATLTALIPAGVPVGSPQLAITVQGTGFLATAQVEFGNQTVPTTWVSDTELGAVIGAHLLLQSTTRSVRVLNSGATSNPLPFQILDPVLTALDPGAVLVGSPATRVTLAGANFGTWSQVRFRNQFRPTTFVDATHVSFVIDQVDLQSPGQAGVQVDNLPTSAGGQSATLQFAVVDPLLSSLSPGAIPVGSAAFPLTANGQAFGPASRIRFDGHLLVTTAYTATTVTATVDVSYLQSAGAVEVEVVGSATGGGTSNSLTFDIDNPVPAIGSITPAGVQVAESNRSLTITGTGFINSSRVMWNGAQRSTRYVDGTTLTSTLTSADFATAGIAQVQIANPAPGGGLSPAVPFTVANPLPAIAGISPQGYQAGDPSSEVMIYGSSFNSQSVVDLDDVALVINSVSSGQVRAQVPASSLASARTATLRVTNPAPGGGYASVPLPIRNPVPVTASLSPTGAIVGSGAVQLDVFGPPTGSGFNSQSSVLWNGSPLPTTVIAGNQLRASVDAARLAALAYVSVSVFNPAPGGGTSNGLSFTVGNPIATVAALTPSSVTAGGNPITVAITGNGFAAGCVARWNGQSLTTVRIGSTQVTATVGASLLAFGGSYPVRVDNPAPGGGASNALPFTVVNPAPGLTSIAPDSLATSPVGASISVTGTNFVRQSVVRCNGTPLTTGWVSSGTLTATVPASFLAAAGSLSISVFTPSPGGGTSQDRTLSVVNPVPSLSTASPMITAVGVPATLTLVGGGFNGQSLVLISWEANPGGVLVSPFSWSTGMLTAILPAAYFPSPVELRLAVFNPAPGGGTSTAMPFVIAEPSPPVADGGPVTFSVSGPVHPQTEGLRWRRGTGPSTPFTVRAPAVAAAIGLTTAQPGDVQDYAVAAMPAEAELFQSEPDLAGVRPSGTNNQILVADAVGLVAGTPLAVARDNIDGCSFGEDWFGVTAVSVGTGGLAATPTQWRFRTSLFLPNIVTGDAGTSFRFGVDPHARGLARTGVAIESLRFDHGSGLGPWLSPGNAGGEVFGTPTLTLPGAPALGTNELVHDRVSLALAGLVNGATAAEDDLDALECIGDNDPASWFVMFPGMVGAGNLHARVMELLLHPLFPGGLAPPGVPIHGVGVGGVTSPPVFFTVDRGSTGKALSAVRTQARAGEAAGDVFMAWNDSNLLLIDEQEAGLYPGVLGLLPCDDMDALLLLVHPEDRYYLVELAQYHVPYSGLVVEHDPDPTVTGDEYRTGPGYSYSLLRYAWQRDGRKLRIRLAFSVTTDSIGLAGTPVDYEAGLDPSGTMQQSGDIYFTQFGAFDPVMGEINPVPEFADYGTHYRWYEAADIGLSEGSWVIGASTDLADLPDELDALDSTPDRPGGPGLFAGYGTGCAGTGNIVPDLDVTGRATDNRVIAFGLSGGLGGNLGVLIQSLQAVDAPFLPGCNLLVPAGNSAVTFLGPLYGTGPGEGTATMSLRLPPGLAGLEIATQAAVLDAGSSNGLVATTRGIMLRFE